MSRMRPCWPKPWTRRTSGLWPTLFPSPQAAWNVDARSGTSKDLRTMLERYLPLYMVPSHFVQLEALPINQQTGKLERKALPATRAARPKAAERPPLPQCMPPRKSAARLCETFGARSSNVDSDSLQDDWDFFDVGGHSLAGMEITLGIEQTVCGLNSVALRSTNTQLLASLPHTCNIEGPIWNQEPRWQKTRYYPRRSHRRAP